jgi:hypothetical protein
MSDVFTRHFFRYYIAKIAGQDFTSISEIALEIFVDAAIYRLGKYAREIRSFIEHSGRTEPNGYDVFQILRRYRETMKDLATFIVDRQTPMENLVRDYPITQGLKFDALTQQGVFPFRVGPSHQDPSDNTLPHIPRFLPSPFSIRGLPADPAAGTGNLDLMRREIDTEKILVKMKEEARKRPVLYDIDIDCPLVSEIVNAVIGVAKDDGEEVEQTSLENLG